MPLSAFLPLLDGLAWRAVHALMSKRKYFSQLDLADELVLSSFATPICSLLVVVVVLLLLLLFTDALCFWFVAVAASWLPCIHVVVIVTHICCFCCCSCLLYFSNCVKATTATSVVKEKYAVGSSTD